MLQEIVKNIFRAEIPLPQSPLKATNSYIIMGSNRNLVVDTGWNRPECFKVMEGVLRQLGIELEETDFFITHYHSDHLGLAPEFATIKSRIYMSKQDADTAYFGSIWDSIMKFGPMSGLSEEQLKQVFAVHPGFKYRCRRLSGVISVKEEDVIDLGNYEFRVLETPGHTEGHLCLYEFKRKLLLSGDHLLGNITPVIQSWSIADNPLKCFLESLRKVNVYDVKLVLPGHRRVFENCKGRADELVIHHEKRTREVLQIVSKEPSNAVKIASQMAWDTPEESFAEFPALQKLLATGEVNAHLRFLEEKGLIKRTFKQNNMIFSVN
jgi:glyoxylase-like metal-dependent hydrolase (beta-lactamase superfamily II)